MKRRCLPLILGAWLMGTLMMFVVAPTNFRLVDALLAHSQSTSFRALVAELGPGAGRELLRYLSSELNRSFFLSWNIAQAVLGAGALLLFAGDRGSPEGSAAQRARRRRLLWPLALATALVLVLTLVFMPLITSLGRSLDFVPRQPPPPALARFQLLHVGYTLLDLIKLGCLAVAAFWFVRGEPAAPLLGPALGGAPEAAR